MNMISVCVIGAFAAICGAALRKNAPETSSLLIVCAVAMLALSALPYLSETFVSVRSLADKANVKPMYIEAVLKSVGICFLTRITSDICRENGAQSAASQIEMCGRLSVVMIAVPLYSDILNMVSSFLG